MTPELSTLQRFYERLDTATTPGESDAVRAELQAWLESTTTEQKRTLASASRDFILQRMEAIEETIQQEKARVETQHQVHPATQS